MPDDDGVEVAIVTADMAWAALSVLIRSAAPDLRDRMLDAMEAQAKAAGRAQKAALAAQLQVKRLRIQASGGG